MADNITLDQVRDFIFHVEDPAVISRLYEIIADQNKRVGARLSFTFEKGDPVFFIKGKRPARRITGKVVTSDTKYIYILEDGRPAGHGGWNWKVSPTLVKKIEAPAFPGTNKVKVV